MKEFDFNVNITETQIIEYAVSKEGEVNGYFIPKNLDESIFYLTDLDVIPRN